MTVLHSLPITLVFGALQRPAQEALFSSYAGYPVDADWPTREQLTENHLVVAGALMQLTPFGEAVVEQREEL